MTQLNDSKAVLRLLELRSHLLTNPNSEFRIRKSLTGQFWGGARVMVISDDQDTFARFKHSDATKVVTRYGPQIGNLFHMIKNCMSDSPAYSFETKFFFWQEIANEGCRGIEANNSIGYKELAGLILDRAIAITREIERTND